MGTPQSREVKGLAWDPGVMEMAGPESLLLFPLSVSRPVTSEDCLLTVRVYLLPDGAASASDRRLGGGQNSGIAKSRVCQRSGSLALPHIAPQLMNC